MNVAIAGFGIEGKASYDYFTHCGDTVTILDERSEVPDLPANALVRLGATALENLGEFDMVVRTPSLPPYKVASAKKIWSATNEFFARCPAPIIGVTGTKGKGTTCSLAAAILREAGKNVHVVGNIGLPALTVLADVKPEDVVVYELSSFQLWDLEKSPHIAVVLMIEPDHLNVHADFDEYARAKGNIAAHQGQGDVVIYHPSNATSARVAALSPSLRIRYMTPEAAYVQDGNIVIDDAVLCPVAEVGLKGEYNLENVCAAASAAWQLTNDTSAFHRAISEFKGLEHRLEYVTTKRGVDFYNDSFSSAPTATMAAISAFDEPIVLIVGGSDKGVNLAPLAEHISQVANVAQVIVIGQVREQIADGFRRVGFNRFVVSDEKSMDQIVKLAMSYAPEGGVVLLSPGCASFDMFKNFYDRGKLFKEAVAKLDV